jgi:hypothetical protein
MPSIDELDFKSHFFRNPFTGAPTVSAIARRRQRTMSASLKASRCLFAVVVACWLVGAVPAINVEVFDSIGVENSTITRSYSNDGKGPKKSGKKGKGKGPPAHSIFDEYPELILSMSMSMSMPTSKIETKSGKKKSKKEKSKSKKGKKEKGKGKGAGMLIIIAGTSDKLETETT